MDARGLEPVEVVGIRNSTRFIPRRSSSGHGGSAYDLDLHFDGATLPRPHAAGSRSQSPIEKEIFS